MEQEGFSCYDALGIGTNGTNNTLSILYAMYNRLSKSVNT